MNEFKLKIIDTLYQVYFALYSRNKKFSINNFSLQYNVFQLSLELKETLTEEEKQLVYGMYKKHEEEFKNENK